MAVSTAGENRDVYISEMMQRLGIRRGDKASPNVTLQCETAFQRCKSCQSKPACRQWLDCAPSWASLAPHFCPNADHFFELQFDQFPLSQTGPQDTLILNVDDLHNMPIPSEEALHRVFKLTAAETKLAQRIARGDSVEEIALSLDIKISTARSRLALIYSKTQTGKQPKLVAVLSRLAHLLPACKDSKAARPNQN